MAIEINKIETIIDGKPNNIEYKIYGGHVFLWKLTLTKEEADELFEALKKKLSK